METHDKPTSTCEMRSSVLTIRFPRGIQVRDPLLYSNLKKEILVLSCIIFSDESYSELLIWCKAVFKRKIPLSKVSRLEMWPGKPRSGVEGIDFYNLHINSITWASIVPHGNDSIIDLSRTGTRRAMKCASIVNRALSKLGEIAFVIHVRNDWIIDLNRIGDQEQLEFAAAYKRVTGVPSGWLLESCSFFEEELETSFSTSLKRHWTGTPDALNSVWWWFHKDKFYLC